MTRWSLRRRFGVTQDTERRYQPEAAEPEAARGRDGQAASQPDAATAGQPGATQPANWFEPGSGQQGTGQYGPGQYSPGQYSAAAQGQFPGQPAASPQAGGVAVLTPAQPSAWQASAQPPAAPAAARDVLAEPGLAELAVRQGGSWPDICDQFGLHLLVLAEQLRASLDELESDEGDPERLRRLYQVDHAVTRMRRASRDLRTLAGRSEEELAGFTTSLLDVIRMAASAIERYTQVTVGRVTDLAVLGYAADDVGSLMSALLDNATRYSPGTVTRELPPARRRRRDVPRRGHRDRHRGGAGRHAQRRPWPGRYPTWMSGPGGTPGSPSCTGSRASTRSACGSPRAPCRAAARSRW